MGEGKDPLVKVAEAYHKKHPRLHWEEVVRDVCTMPYEIFLDWVIKVEQEEG